MTKIEPKAIQEVHAARLKIYEETRNMNSTERTARTNEIGDAMLKKYGLSHLKAKAVNK